MQSTLLAESRVLGGRHSAVCGRSGLVCVPSPPGAPCALRLCLWVPGGLELMHRWEQPVSGVGPEGFLSLCFLLPAPQAESSGPPPGPSARHPVSEPAGRGWKSEPKRTSLSWKSWCWERCPAILEITNGEIQPQLSLQRPLEPLPAQLGRAAFAPALP